MSTLIKIIGLIFLVLYLATCGHYFRAAFATTGDGLNVHIYSDDNNNGQRDAGEGGIADYSVQLVALDNGNVTGQMTEETDSDGDVNFGALLPGRYAIVYSVGILEIAVTGEYQSIELAIHYDPALWLPLISKG